MSFILYNFELTTYCNAKCPSCTRTVLDLKNFVLNPFKAHQMVRYREAVLLYKKCNDTINSIYDNFF